MEANELRMDDEAEDNDDDGDDDDTVSYGTRASLCDFLWLPTIAYGCPMLMIRVISHFCIGLIFFCASSIPSFSSLSTRSSVFVVPPFSSACFV